MENLTAGLGADTLSEVLGAVRFRSAVYCRSELTAPWGFRVIARPTPAFHIIEEGSCSLEVESVAGTFTLRGGDLVVLPHGHAHAVRDRPGSPAPWLEDVLATHPLEGGFSMRCGGGGERTSILCGGFFLEDGTSLPFLSSLPPVLHVAGEGGRTTAWLRVAREVIVHETAEGRVGASTMLSRLADMLFVEAIRSYFSDAGGEPRGWLAALRDPGIGAALALIHRDPQRPWTVDALADAAAMSRSAFSLRFNVLLGASPMRYVTSCRIQRALRLLASPSVSVAQVAERVGYESEIAFSRAFKRRVGLSPATYRRGLQRHGVAARG
jgi:AraC-like DNA-binding protein